MLLTFGKYTGKTLDEVFELDGQYIVWLSSVKDSIHAMRKETKDEIAKIPSEITMKCKEMIAGKCTLCLRESHKKAVDCPRLDCNASRSYHYHPYGKRLSKK